MAQKKGIYTISWAGGATFEMPYDRVLWFKQIDPMNPYARGLGNAEAIGEEVEADELAAKWNKRFFYNSARPDIIIQTETELTEEVALRLQERWMEKYQGVKNAYKPGILDNGATIHELTRPHTDMDFSMLRNGARDTILGNWALPKPIMGITEDVNRANAEAGEYLFARWVIQPRLTFWTFELNQKFLSMWDSRIKIEFPSPLPEDRDRTIKESDIALKQGVITVNEYRIRMGLQPRPDGDVLYIPSNIKVANNLQDLIFDPNAVKPGDSNKPEEKPENEKPEEEKPSDENEDNSESKKEEVA
jgi:HK97 family phage portal protein